MKLFASVALAALLCLPASAEDVYKGLKRGDKIVITMKDGGKFRGVVKSVVGNTLRVEVTYDRSDVTGSVDFDREEIKSIDPQGSMSKEEMDRIQKEHEAAIKAEQNKATHEKPTEDGEKPKELTKEEKQAALLAKFPPGAWTVKRQGEIVAKNEYDRTDEEREFLNVFADWQAAVVVQEKKDRAPLLDKFPPAAGWSEEKYNSLKTQFIRTGVQLTDVEHEFVDKFSDWKQAVEDKKKADEEKTDEEGKKAAEAKPTEMEPKKEWPK